MKKSQLLEILKDVPDDTDLGFINENYDHGHTTDMDLCLNPLFHKKTGEVIYFLNRIEDTIKGYGSKEEFERSKKLDDFAKNFPSDKYWSIERPSYMDETLLVSFRVDGYNRKFTITLPRTGKQNFLLDHDKKFDTHAEFFELTKGFVRECIKMHQQKLEQLLQELGTLN